MRDQIKSGKGNNNTQTNEQTRGEKKCNEIRFGSSRTAFLGLAEDKKDLRVCPFCQDLCCPMQDGAKGKVS
jgi:hypothetical protein